MSLPNYITLLRIVLVPVFFTELLSYQAGETLHRTLAAVVFFTACLTDAIDGFLARLLNLQTKLGSFLDPLADKLILLSGYLGILFVPALRYHPPLWVTVTIVFRDMVLLVGLVILSWINGTVEVKPNLLGKCTTALQMATLGSILLEWNIAALLWYPTAGFTIFSCIVYVIRGLKNLPFAS